MTWSEAPLAFLHPRNPTGLAYVERLLFRPVVIMIQYTYTQTRTRLLSTRTDFGAETNYSHRLALFNPDWFAVVTNIRLVCYLVNKIFDSGRQRVKSSIIPLRSFAIYILVLQQMLHVVHPYRRLRTLRLLSRRIKHTNAVRNISLHAFFSAYRLE